jgi:hypothetical protein
MTDKTPLGSHVAWCQSMHSMLQMGGYWAVPRSGLIFRKSVEGLVLVEVMPWMADMPMTEDELHKYQESDYLEHQRQFELAGIRVLKSPSVTSF